MLVVAHTGMCGGPEGNFLGSVLSFYLYLGSGDQTQVLRFGGVSTFMNLLSHLPALRFCIKMSVSHFFTLGCLLIFFNFPKMLVL